MNNRAALLLVGGKGTRLGPIGLYTPKCLMKVGDKTILEHQLDMLMLNNIRRVVLCTGHLSHIVEKFVKSLSYPYRLLSIHISKEEGQPLGTAGALFKAHKEHVGSGDWIALNGDVFCPEIRIPDAEHNIVQIAISRHQEPYGRVRKEMHGMITAFFEKQEWEFSAGVYVFPDSDSPWIKSIETSIEKETFPRLVSENKLSSWLYAGPWFDLGTPERIAECERWLSSEHDV